MPNNSKDKRKNNHKNNGLSYAQSGVDIDAGNALVEAIKPAIKSTTRPGSDSVIGGFGGLFDLKAAGFKDPVLVAANDGVGTKLRVAIEAHMHGDVGIDLVAMCVNDLIVQGAEPLFFLDYFATGKLDVEHATQVVNGIAKGCKIAGCALIGGETAEMPGMYSGEDYDLAGFSVGAAERGELLPRNIEIGDKILGLASSGVHSNGFSLVRKIIELENLDWQAPAPFDKGKSLGEKLLTPTRIYVKSILATLKQGEGIHGLAHITGGGFWENIPRVLGEDQAANLDLSTIEVPPVFGWLQKCGGVDTLEMMRTFNCGVGMVVIVAADQADNIAKSLADEGEQVFHMGEVTKREYDAVVYQNFPRF